MSFPDAGTYPISNKDVLSFTFDDPEYDIDRPLIIDPRDTSLHFTHGTAKDLVRRLIAGLHAAGLQRNDTVCIHSFNSIVYPLLVLAVIGAGGRSVGTNPSYTRSELNHGVRVAKIRFVFAEPEILENMRQALKENDIDIGSRLFVLDTQSGQQVPADLMSWKTLLEHGASDWIRFDSEARSREIAQLYYTSGTTGLPKCAMTSHRNLIAEHQLYQEDNHRSYPISMVLTMPFFHVGILPYILISVLKGGHTAYIMRRFDLKPYLRYHSQYSISEMQMVPPMVYAIVTSGLASPGSPTYDPKYRLTSVMRGTTGAAPCSADMQSRFAALLSPAATFTQVWGMTETTSIAATVPARFARHWGALGHPVKSTSMKLVSPETGERVTSPPFRGELCVAGPTVVQGYFDNPTATAASWDDEGYYKTGDVVRLDPATGMMYMVERSKELIKVRGFQVAPAELEGALTEHPDITDAAVIGVKDDGGDDERPKALVVIRAGSRLTERDVHEHMRERVAGFKQLTGGVRFVESIPKLPSGKILKRVLREEESRREAKATQQAKL